MHPLLALLDKPKKRVVGLMSGTSIDGIDAALCDIEGAGADAKVNLVDFRFTPYTDDQRRAIHELLRGDAADIAALPRQEGGGDLHAPLSQVLHRRLTEEIGKPLSQRRARQTNLTCQLIDRPTVSRPRVYEPQRGSDVAVAQGGQPPGRIRRQPLNVVADGLQK